VAIEAVGREIAGWRRGLEVADRAQEGTLSFAQGRIVPTVAVVFQKKRFAAKDGNKSLR